MSWSTRIYARAHHMLGSQRGALTPGLSGNDRWAILWRAGGGFLRGLWLRLWARESTGVVLVGKGARITHRAHLRLGRNVKIEEHAEVHALSTDGVHLGDGVTIGRGASIRPSSYYGGELGVGLTVGAGSAIGPSSWIGASGRVTIGNDVLLGPGVIVIPENHVFQDTERTIKEQGVVRDEVIIEDDCWLGARATILSGVRIGRGSIVAAGAVVHRDVPPFSIVGGVPARILKSRRQEAA